VVNSNSLFSSVGPWPSQLGGQHHTLSFLGNEKQGGEVDVRMLTAPNDTEHTSSVWLRSG
jgi:hypothetical protein